MPFYRLKTLGIVHIKGRKLPKPCGQAVGIQTSDGAAMQVCGDMSGFLCDWPAESGRTCDAPLCAAHARQIAKNRHYCPAHIQEHATSQRQAGLFTELVQP